MTNKSRETFEAEILKFVQGYYPKAAREQLEFSRDPETGEYLAPNVQMAHHFWQAGRKQMAEEAAAVVAPWRNAQHLKLHAGECTAQEVRTVKAVLFAIEGRIRSLATPTEGKA